MLRKMLNVEEILLKIERMVVHKIFNKNQIPIFILSYTST